jgi:hypothetical protein
LQCLEIDIPIPPTFFLQRVIMVQIIPLDQPDVPPMTMPDRFRKEVVYFMTPAEGHGAPPLGKDEYWVRLEDSARWLDDGFFSLVSPLDAHSVAEIEITEEQEEWLEWMVKNKITSIRLGASQAK